LVTGATGFIGRRLVSDLVGRGYAVVAAARDPARASVLPEGVTVRRADLAEPDSLRGLMDEVDLVFHVAAAMRGGWEEHRRTTVEGTRALLELCRRAKVTRFVHTSSIAAYRTAGLAPHSVLGADSPLDDAESADGPYARAKVLTEGMVRAALDTGFDAVIVRPGIVYGPGQLAFQQLGRRIAGRLVAAGGPDLVLPLTHVGSVSDALIRVAEAPGARGKAYPVVDCEVSVGEYLALFEELSGRPLRRWHLPLPLAAAAFAGIGLLRGLPGLGTRLPQTSAAKLRRRNLSLHYDASALARDTGWKPLLTLREGLAQSLGAPR
jgi:nucleoside-diphosphate-sugar epimerase